MLGSLVSLRWAQEEKWDSANFLTYALIPVLPRLLRAVTETALDVRLGDPLLVLSALGVGVAVTLISGSYPL